MLGVLAVPVLPVEPVLDRRHSMGPVVLREKTERTATSLSTLSERALDSATCFRLCLFYEKAARESEPEARDACAAGAASAGGLAATAKPRAA